MKMDFPQVDLPTEVLAWTNVTEDILNIYKQSCRLQACIVAICTEGSMKASINLLDYEIRPNDLITLLPGTIIQFRERTAKAYLFCSLPKLNDCYREQSFSFGREQKRYAFALPAFPHIAPDEST